MREKPGPPYDLPDLRPVRAIQNRMRLQGGSVVTGNGQFSSEDFIPGEQGWRISGNGDAEFNDVTLRGEIEASEFRGAPTANILGVNGTFDDDTTGWAAYTTAFPNSQIDRVTSPVRSGSGALRIQSSSGAGVRGAYTEVTVAPGDIVHAAGWVLKDDLSEGASDTWWDTVTVNVDFYDSTDTLVHQYFNESIQSAGWYDGAGYSPTPEWRLVEVYAAAPLNLDITKARIYFSSYSNAAVLGRYALYLDDVTIGIAPLLEVPYMVTHEDDERKRSLITPQQFAFESQFSNYPYGLLARHNAHTPSLRITGPYGFGSQAPQLELEHDLLNNLRLARFSVDQVLTGGQVLAPNGSVGNPAYTFASDLDTGLYRVGANHVGIAAAGSLSTSFTANSARFSDGTAAAPGITFQSDTNTGILRPAADTMQFSCGGTVKLALASGTVLMDLAASASAYQPVHRDSTFGTIVRYTSSRRFKERIETLDGADLVSQLRPVTFYPKEGHGDPSRQSVGFIAEEVADVDPRLTTTGPDGEPDGLDTNAMLAALVAEVQSLRQRVASLEAATA